MTTPEHAVKQKVKTLLDRYKPRLWYCMPAARVYGKSGVPDFIGVFYGNFFAVETKAGNNKLSAMQKMQLFAISNAMGKWFVVKEDTVWVLADWLRALHCAQQEAEALIEKSKGLMKWIAKK